MPSCSWRSATPPPSRRSPTANVKQAEATVEQWRTDQAELVIHAPIRGQVTTSIAELGENFGVGAPLFSIVDLEDPWFTFNLREDLLEGLKVGDEFTVTVPACRRRDPAEGDDDQRPGPVRDLAGDARDRRFRSAHLRGARRADHAAWTACVRA